MKNDQSKVEKFRVTGTKFYKGFKFFILNVSNFKALLFKIFERTFQIKVASNFQNFRINLCKARI